MARACKYFELYSIGVVQILLRKLAYSGGNVGNVSMQKENENEMNKWMKGEEKGGRVDSRNPRRQPEQKGQSGLAGEEN